MNLTDEQRKEFEEVTKKVIEWLNNNCHPHVTVIIDATHAELTEGVCAYKTNEFIKD